MNKARSDRCPRRQADVLSVRAAEPPATVASLGVQAHLVAADPERERQLSDLIAACEAQRAQWECLFQRILAHLKDEGRWGDDDNRSSPRAAL